MALNVTDPAILFPGISLLFLAYTNRYLALANIIRQLNKVIGEHYNDPQENQQENDNREKQIQNLLARIALIRYMQLLGILAFICCTVSMSGLLLGFPSIGRIAFGGSMVFMFLSLCVAFTEIARSGDGLRLEIERTHPKNPLETPHANKPE